MTEYNTIIEIPANSAIKYELDKEENRIEVDRFLFTSMHYPFNYGFIPETVDLDGDPVDVLVLTREAVFPGASIKVRPIGVLGMKDEAGESDMKVLAVPVEKLDPQYKGIKEYTDVPEILRQKVEHFFEHYKELEPDKWVKIGEWGDAQKANQLIEEASERFTSS